VADDHTPACDDEGCYCPDDVFWGRLLGDDDPCAPGKDWVAAAFGPLDDDTPAPATRVAPVRAQLAARDEEQADG
jgi:hypothetical protein